MRTVDGRDKDTIKYSVLLKECKVMMDKSISFTVFVHETSKYSMRSAHRTFCPF